MFVPQVCPVLASKEAGKCGATAGNSSSTGSDAPAQENSHRCDKRLQGPSNMHTTAMYRWTQCTCRCSCFLHAQLQAEWTAVTYGRKPYLWPHQ